LIGKKLNFFLKKTSQLIKQHKHHSFGYSKWTISTSIKSQKFNIFEELEKEKRKKKKGKREWWWWRM